jgi:hypothetical protein
MPVAVQFGVEVFRLFQERRDRGDGELEALDQSVSDLLIARFALMAREPFAKSLHSVTERSGGELHSASIYINRAILPRPQALPIIGRRTKRQLHRYGAE